MKTFLQWPAWLWIAILVPRLVFFILAVFHPAACVPPDGFNYLRLAENLWESHVFSSAAAPPWVPETFRVPGYPLFLAPFTALKAPILMAALGQSLLGAVTALLIGGWLRQMTDEEGARAGVLVLAVDALILLHTPMILAETLVLFLEVIALLFTWQALQHPDTQKVFTSGFVWGITALIKPVFLYFPLVLAWLWWKQKKRLAVFLLAAYCLPLGWVLRNGLQANFWGLSTQSGFALLLYPASGIEAMRTGRPLETVQRELKEQVDAQYPGGYANEQEQNRVYSSAAARILKDHPVLLARYCAIGAIRMLAGTGASLWLAYTTQTGSGSGWSLEILGEHTRTLFREHPWLVPIQIAYGLALAALYLLSLKGWYRLWESGRTHEALLIAGGVLYLLIISSHQGYSRFRIPMMPFLAAATAAAFSKRPLLQSIP